MPAFIYISFKAVFKKILSKTKNKINKGPDIKFNAEGPGTSAQQPTTEEFEERKQVWQVNENVKLILYNNH